MLTSGGSPRPWGYRDAAQSPRTPPSALLHPGFSLLVGLMAGLTLFVGRLPPSARSEQLEELFSQVGL